MEKTPLADALTGVCIITASRSNTYVTPVNFEIFASSVRQKHSLQPSPSLRRKHGEKGVAARKEYLRDRELNDERVNHMVSLIHRGLYDSMMEAKGILASKPGMAGEWAKAWPSAFPCLGIMENRRTPLHRDTNGAHFCADFLSLLGNFSGGDLVLQDLNLKLEWVPGAAAMFDGRSLAHQVESWTGARRICVVQYLWKSAFVDLRIQLPNELPCLRDIQSRVERARGECLLRTQKNTT